MTRPRSAEDLDELHLRARLRLERRRTAAMVAIMDGGDLDRGSYRITLGGFAKLAQHGSPQATLVREASALVAAIDALREDDPIPLDVPPHHDGRDGSIEISAAEEDAYIAGMDENMRRGAWGDR